MYVQSPTAAPFMSPTVDTPAPTDAASSAASAQSAPPITQGALTRAEGMLGTLLQVKVDVLDAYTILFDFLNTGSEDSFVNAIRHATKNFPPPETAIKLPVSAQLKQPSPPFSPSLNHSWPQKVLMCKDGGAHAKLTLSMYKESLTAESGINRDSKKLLPGSLQEVPLPEPTPPKRRLTLTEFNHWYVKNHMNPAIEALKPNQVMLMAPPRKEAFLIGRDDAGRKFGLAARPHYIGGKPSPRVFNEEQLEFMLLLIRDSHDGPGSWVHLQPR